MFPEKWRKFLEKFDYETNKPRGKLILDYSPDTSDEHRIVKLRDEMSRGALQNNQNIAFVSSFRSNYSDPLTSIYNPWKLCPFF